MQGLCENTDILMQRRFATTLVFVKSSKAKGGEFFKMLLKKLIVLILSAILAHVNEVKADANCDKYGVLVYEDLGCKAIKDKPDDLCPSSYDCRHFHDFGVHCYFQGQKYSVNDVIPENITQLSCNAGCFCTDQGSFTCAVLDCPEWLGVPSKSPDCVRTHLLDRCCSTGELCPPFDNVATCEVDGQTYKEGQKFYPKDSCSVCICQKGFSGKYEAPYCRPLSCGTELKHRSDLEKHCAPVYEKKDSLCCPVFWACLSEDDVVNPADKPSESKDKCIFGNKNVKIGETVQKSVERYGKQHVVKCDCKVAPLLTCIIQGS